MSSKSWSIILACLGITLICQSGFCHEGRRFELLVVGGQIVAQGLNTGADDGAPPVRPYTNAIHDHWSNSPLGLPNALATLPAFEVPHTEISLVGQPLYFSLDSVARWESPPLMPAPDTHIELTALPDGELLKIDTGLGIVDSNGRGTALLTSSVPVGGASDLDLLYTINKLPTTRFTSSRRPSRRATARLPQAIRSTFALARWGHPGRAIAPRLTFFGTGCSLERRSRTRDQSAFAQYTVFMLLAPQLVSISSGSRANELRP